jgi:hypothetical protein
MRGRNSRQTSVSGVGENLTTGEEEREDHVQYSIQWELQHTWLVCS